MRIVSQSLLAFSVAALAACATTSEHPDLTVSLLETTPTQTTAGSRITINSAIRNSGSAPTGSAAAMTVDLFSDAFGSSFLAPLTAWRQGDGETLAPGAEAVDAADIRAPSALSPGLYGICAAADPDNAIVEANEDNNRACVTLEVTPGAPKSADLIIEKVAVVEKVDASLKIKVTIKNAGSLPASGPFCIMAFRRDPRLPLLFVDCPVSEGQLAAGSPVSCNYVTQSEPLAPGASAELVGYFVYAVEGAGRLIVNWIGPGGSSPTVRRSVDFMVDGCYPPFDHSRVECAVDEIDELNNFKGKTLKVR